ncbi:hypothetical protein PV375_06565 [Gulosibacter sp. GYB002]|uniref:hypothetical protein n=1 Tax=Gulosibacter sp. GYB002 TaxID=2994391 RepID=UPI002F9637DD
MLGQQSAPINRDVVAAQNATIETVARVEKRPLAASVTFYGNITESESHALVPTQLPEAAVVTESPLSSSDRIGSATFIGAIANTPVFAFSGELAMYRDLAANDTGEDVRLLQLAFISAGFDIEANGWVDWATLDAAAQLFDRVGFSLPTREITAPSTVEPESDGDAETQREQPAQREPYIPAMAFVAIPGDSALVISAAGVGDVISAEHPLATVTVGERSIVARVDSSTAAEVDVADAFTAIVAQQQVDVQLVRIGDFDSGADGQIPGHDLYFSVDAEKIESVPGGTTVTLERVVSGDAELVVPLGAIRSDAEGTYVLRKTEKAGDPERVSVKILETGGGWAAIGDTKLREGESVLL